MTVTLAESLGYSILGIAIVFIMLALLMGVIYAMGKAMVQSKKQQPAKAAAPEAPAAPAPAPEAEPPSRVPKEIITLLADSVEMLADEDGYAPLGEVANLLVRKKRDFDPRNFGFSKLSKLVKALPRFEVDVRQGGQSNMKHFFVRDKERK